MNMPDLENSPMKDFDLAFLERWLEALESGKYKQDRLRLRRHDTKPLVATQA